MKSIRIVNRYLVKVVLFTALLMVIVGGLSIQQANASIFDSVQGTLNGGIPAVTRNVKSGKLFQCNQNLVMRKKCAIVDISPDGAYAIVKIPGETGCPAGGWGVINRSTGDSLYAVPGIQRLSTEKVCSAGYKVGFIQSSESPHGYGLAMYYNNKAIVTVPQINF
ncbi:TPA: hypothetical protein ACTPQ1_004754 [Salmonella enterica]